MFSRTLCLTKDQVTRALNAALSIFSEFDNGMRDQIANSMTKLLDDVSWLATLRLLLRDLPEVRYFEEHDYIGIRTKVGCEVCVRRRDDGNFLVLLRYVPETPNPSETLKLKIGSNFLRLVKQMEAADRSVSWLDVHK